jgi:hypothetical protein
LGTSQGFNKPINFANKVPSVTELGTSASVVEFANKLCDGSSQDLALTVDLGSAVAFGSLTVDGITEVAKGCQTLFPVLEDPTDFS